MNWKSLALISTSLVALGFSATAQAAAPTTMGEIEFGFTEWFDNYDGGEGGYDIDYLYPSLTGAARVNIPYDSDINLQLDLFGDASLDEGYQGAFSGKSTSLGNLGFGAHINVRDTSQGLLGIFAATGRVWDIYSWNTSPVIMAGFEGQYYCGHWTFYGQAGYMDSDLYFLEQAGFVRGLVSYYASPKLKLTGGLAYMDGDIRDYGGSTYDATAWAWQADAQYWFGRSVPIALNLKYQGRQAEVEYYSSYNPELTSHELTLGVSLFFGGDSIEEADKTGAGTEIPNFDWFRLPYSSGG